MELKLLRTHGVCEESAADIYKEGGGRWQSTSDGPRNRRPDGREPLGGHKGCSGGVRGVGIASDVGGCMQGGVPFSGKTDWREVSVRAGGPNARVRPSRLHV